MMKSLNNFSSFDMDAFLHGKTLVVKEIKDWLEYKDNQPTGKQLGKKVVTMIVKDDTVYKDKEGNSEKGLNLYEQLSFNVPVMNLDIPQNKIVRPVNITKAIIYGRYQNQLSIECESVQVVKPE